jgi:general secretion pathway protein G
VAVAVMVVGTSVAWQEIEFQVQNEWEEKLPRSREAVIRANLYTMRSCIDQHIADKGFYPESLQALVDEGYLRAIPVDPFSGTDEGAWEELYAEPSELEELEPFEDEHASGNQVIDVRYADDIRVALDGALISEW